MKNKLCVCVCEKAKKKIASYLSANILYADMI